MRLKVPLRHSASQLIPRPRPRCRFGLHPSARLMTVRLFFGSGTAGAGAGAAGATEAALTAGGTTGDGGAAGTVAIGATAPDPRSLGGAAPGLGVMGAVFEGS